MRRTLEHNKNDIHNNLPIHLLATIREALGMGAELVAVAVLIKALKKK